MAARAGGRSHARGAALGGDGRASGGWGDHGAWICGRVAGGCGMEVRAGRMWGGTVNHLMQMGSNQSKNFSARIVLP